MRKVWHQLLREGVEVARCTVARLMGRLGLRGVVCGKAVKTTIGDPATPCPRDEVNRVFQAERPDRLRVADFYLRRVLARVRLCRLRHRRLLERLGYATPAEAEARFWAATAEPSMAA